MKHTLNKIASKSNDYIICNSCKSLNWYENEFCNDCNNKLEPVDENEDAVYSWIKNEYEYWTKEEGYTEKEADNVIIYI